MLFNVKFLQVIQLTFSNVKKVTLLKTINVLLHVIYQNIPHFRIIQPQIKFYQLNAKHVIVHVEVVLMKEKINA